jgi:hypothetical protein
MIINYVNKSLPAALITPLLRGKIAVSVMISQI